MSKAKKGNSGSVGANNKPRKSKKQDEGSTPEQKIEKAFNEIDNGNNMVKMKDLRDKTGLSREDFDKAVNSMRRSGKFTADSAEGGHVKLTQAERDAGLSDYDGKKLTYLSKRT